MATKNVVPRTGSEGKIGTISKRWGEGNFDTIDISGSSRFGSELTDTHVFTGSFLQTGSGATSYFKDTIDIEGNLTASGHVSASALYVSSGVYDDSSVQRMEFFIGGGTRINDEFGNSGFLVGSSNIYLDKYLMFYNNSTSKIEDANNQERISFTDTTDLILNAESSTNVQVTGNLSASGHVSASAFYGDGQHLDNISSEWDGTRNGDAEITGSLTVSGSGNTVYLYLGGPLADIAPGSSNLQIGYDPSTGNDSSVWFGPAGGSAKGIISYTNSSDEFQFKADEFDFNGLGTSTLISVSGNIATTGQIYNSGENKGIQTATAGSPGAVTIDWNDGMTQEIILSSSTSPGTVSASFSNIQPYTTYQLINKVAKDNMELYFDHPIYWPGGIRPSLSNISGSRDIITFTTDGDSNMYGTAQFDYSASVG